MPVDDTDTPCNAAAHAEGSSTAARRAFPMRSILPLLLLCASSNGDPSIMEATPRLDAADPGTKGRSEAEYLPYDVVAGWSIVVEMRDRPACLVLGRFASGTIMRIGVDRDGTPSAYTVFSNPSWKGISPDHDYAVDVAFGEAKAKAMSARSGASGSPPSLTIRLEDVATVRSLATTGSLTIDRAGQRLARLPLTSTSKAIAAMAACQMEIDTVVSALDEVEAGEDVTPPGSDIA
jgi:hypothetical protein